MAWLCAPAGMELPELTMKAVVQLALSDAVKAAALREMLMRSGDVTVECVEKPDIERSCVVVVDGSGFAKLLPPIACPDRVVLITQNDAGHLKEAWEAGVNSVLSEQDPLNTVVLAVLSTCLRARGGGAKLAGERTA